MVDASRRNCVFLATTSSGPTFVVKQAPPAYAAPLAHEATILRLLAGAPELAGHVPVVVHEEHGGGCIVLRTPGGGRDWGDHQGRFPRIPARILGRVLAVLHGLDVRAPTNGSGPAWGLLLPEPPRDLVLELSAGAQDVVARIQASDELCGRLAGLRSADADDALVHGDLRWDNCLALPAPGARRRTRVLLVDWELAGRADPAFDAGSVLAEYLRVWVGSVPIVEAGRSWPARRAGAPSARRDAARRRRVLVGLSRGGRATAGAAAGGRDDGRAAAADRGRARAGSGGAHRPMSSRSLQLADNMLRRPDDAASGPARAASVSRYREQVAAAVRAVTIRGPAQYAWLGHRSRRLPRVAERRALDESERRRHLVSCLREELYFSFYCHGASVPARWGEPEPVSADPWLVEAMSRREYRPRRMGAGLDGRAGRRRRGGRRQPAPAHARGGRRLRRPRRAGAPSVRVRLPKELPASRRATGPSSATPGDRRERRARVLERDARRAPALVGALTSRLNGDGVPFRLKVADHPFRLDRCDAAVLYLDGDVFRAVRPALAERRRSSPRTCDPRSRHSRLGWRRARGWPRTRTARASASGAARCSPTGSSARTSSGLTAIEARVEAVAARFAEDGVAIDAPYLSRRWRTAMSSEFLDAGGSLGRSRGRRGDLGRGPLQLGRRLDGSEGGVARGVPRARGELVRRHGRRRPVPRRARGGDRRRGGPPDRGGRAAPVGGASAVTSPRGVPRRLARYRLGRRPRRRAPRRGGAADERAHAAGRGGADPRRDVDVVLGSAGSTLARLALAELFDEPTLVEDAVAAGEALLARATVTQARLVLGGAGPPPPPRTSAACRTAPAGSAGRCSSSSPPPATTRFRVGAEGAFAYERSGWAPDLRAPGRASHAATAAAGARSRRRPSAAGATARPASPSSGCARPRFSARTRTSRRRAAPSPSPAASSPPRSRTRSRT